MRRIPLLQDRIAFRRAGLTGLLTSAALGLTAPAGLAQTASAPQSGGTLTIAFDRQTECADPQQDNFGFGSFEGRQIVDSLTDQSYEDPTKIVPWLAQSWEISEDARIFTFHLRPDVTFSDGTALDAEAVKRNFEILAKIPGATGAALLEGISAIETEGSHTLRITFDKPNAPFLQATATAELGIVSPASLALTPEQRCDQGVIGSGPFVRGEVRFNEQTSYLRRDGYNWASELRGHQGAALLDSVVFRIVPEGVARTGALQAGLIDLVKTPPYTEIPLLESGGFDILYRPYLGLTAILVINSRAPVLAEKAVRQALQKGTNREEVALLAYDGHLAGSTGVLTAGSPFFLDQTGALSYDPEGARAILDAAGWTVGEDGIRTRDGARLTVTKTFWAGASNQLASEVLQQQWRDIGIDLQLRPLVGGAFNEAVLAGDYDLHRTLYARADSDVLRSVFATDTQNKFQLEPGNALDPLLDAQKATAHPEERAEAAKAAQALIVEEAWGIPFVDFAAHWAAAPKVQDVTFGPGGTAGPNLILYDAWLAPQ